MKTISSSFLILILLSSAVIGPMSVSSYSIPVAYAESSDITDISNYVIYGLEKVEIDKDVTIQSGNIGLHDDSKKKGEIKIKKDVEFVDSESSIVANKIKIEKDAIVPNVFYNELDNKGTILGTENTPLDLPVVNNLPEFPEFEAGDEKIKVDKNESLTLSPGDYGKVELKKGSMIIFEGGIYNIESLKADKDSQILFEDSSEVRVEKDVKLDKMVILGPHPDSEINASDIIFFVGDDKKSKIEFGKSSVIYGVFYSPEGEIKMKKESQVTGSFIANKIKVEKDVTLTLDSGDTLIQDLVDEYLGLIEKLDIIGSTLDQTSITQELIDEIQNDLDRISQIVIELQILGYDGIGTQVRQGTQMVGIVTFFDENTLETLFEIQIPDNTLAIFGLMALINEFADDEVPLTFEEQQVLLQEGFELVEIITNSESDDVASLFVLASIDAFHPSTGNTWENSALYLGGAIQKSLPTLAREAMKACKLLQSCENLVLEIGTSISPDGVKILQKIIDERWIVIQVSGFIFNDNNNNTVPESDERIPNESFQISFRHSNDDVVRVSTTFSSPMDGNFEFDNDFIFAPFTKIQVFPIISTTQTFEGWVQSNEEFEEDISINIPNTDLIIDDVEIGMVELATLNVLINVNGGSLNPSDFEIIVEDNLSNTIVKSGTDQPIISLPGQDPLFTEFRILEGEFDVDITPQSGYFAQFSPFGYSGIISIDSPPVDACVVTMNFGTSPPTDPTFDEIWQYREHNRISAFPPNYTFTKLTSGDKPLHITSTIGGAGDSYVFKTFKKSEIGNHDLRITWSGTSPVASGNNQWNFFIVDGAFDRSNNVDFPTNSFPPVKGAGSLERLVFITPSFGPQTDTITPDWASSQLDDVTIFARVTDSGTQRSITGTVNSIEIVDVAKWTFTDPTITAEVSGTLNDYGTYSSTCVGCDNTSPTSGILFPTDSTYNNSGSSSSANQNFNDI